MIATALALTAAAPTHARAQADMQHPDSWELALNFAGGGGEDGTRLDRATLKCSRDSIPDILCTGENFSYGMIQFDARIMTPRQMDIPAAPRFFVRAAIAKKFGADVGVDVVDLDEDTDVVFGEVEQDGVIWDVGLGISFPFTWGSREFRLEPSLSYGQEKGTATSKRSDSDDSNSAKTDVKMHFIKQMIEVTTPVANLRGLRIDGFAGIAVQHYFKTKIRRHGAFDNPGFFDYDKSIGFGGFVGIRLTLHSSGSES